MEPSIAGAAWPEEHPALRAALRTLEVAVRIEGLRRAKPFIAAPPR